MFDLLADVVVLIHFLWIVFLVFGAIFGVRYRAVKVLHVCGLAFALIIQIADWYCPLTYLEAWLRMRYDPSGSYEGSFIIHYIERIVYWEVSRTAVFITTVLLVLFNLRIYTRSSRGRAENR